VIVLAAGLALEGWVFRTRSPASVLESTYITFLKLARRVPLAESSGRTEPLVLRGPQKYSRNPLYLGVVVMLVGWSLLTALSFVLVATVVILLWFRLFLIPFEERELFALFGGQYKRYTDSVPMLIPFTKRKTRIR
jgi:protein-S-isoprenylcysteine O-methyltransferase Ste14